MRISAVINTLNEQKNIADCILSVKDYVDEIVICDMHSNDRTVEIAQSLGARIVLYERVKGYWGGEPRRYAIQHAIGNWILMIDADERLTPELGMQLRQVAIDDYYDCVKFAKLTLYFGDFPRYGDFFLPNQPLFFRKDVYLNRYTGVENRPHNDWAAVSNIEKTLILPVKYHYIHLAYPTVEKYVVKTLGMYASIEGEQYFMQGRKFSVIRLVGEPFREFIHRFIFKTGYRDGMRGFILAILYACYRFTTWANVWFLEQQVMQEKKRSSETT
jgi:glycosyltransferase involved in cell wall biosynthesis